MILRAMSDDDVDGDVDEGKFQVKTNSKEQKKKENER